MPICHEKKPSQDGPARGLRIALVAVVFFVESFYATLCTADTLFPGEEWVAGGADFDLDVALAGGAGREFIAASADYFHFVIIWVNPWFHRCTPLSHKIIRYSD